MSDKNEDLKKVRKRLLENYLNSTNQSSSENIGLGNDLVDFVRQSGYDKGLKKHLNRALEDYGQLPKKMSRIDQNDYSRDVLNPQNAIKDYVDNFQADDEGSIFTNLYKDANPFAAVLARRIQSKMMDQNKLDGIKNLDDIKKAANILAADKYGPTAEESDMLDTLRKQEDFTKEDLRNLRFRQTIRELKK